MFTRALQPGWHSIPQRVLLKCIAVIVLLGSLPAGAGSIAIAPLRLTFSGASVIASVTVANNGPVETLVQAETFAWHQEGGESRLVPTDDVVAVPPVFRLAPGAQQQVRVGLTRAFTEKSEQAFRLTVTEVPTIAKADTVNVAIRHSLPVFVLPAGAISPALQARSGAPGHVELTNSGSQHLRILRWRLRDSGGAVLAEGSGPGYLLAGASQTVSLGNFRITAPLVFEADSDARTLKLAVGE